MTDLNKIPTEQLSLHDRSRALVYESLYSLVDSSSKPKTLGNLGQIARYVANESPGDIFFDLFIWAGLKSDTPSMGEDYKKNVLTPSGFIEDVWRRHQASQTSKKNVTENHSIKAEKKHGSVDLVVIGLISTIARCSRSKERDSAQRIWFGLSSYLKAGLTSQKYTALESYCLSVFNQTSFFSSYYTYQHCRELWADLPEQPNSTWRRRIRNALEHTSWPNVKAARAAKSLTRALTYKP